MDLTKALLIAISVLAAVVSFLFKLYYDSTSKQIEELKTQLALERKKVEELQKDQQKDMERILSSNIEVVKSNMSVLNKILNDK